MGGGSKSKKAQFTYLLVYNSITSLAQTSLWPFPKRHVKTTLNPGESVQRVEDDLRSNQKIFCS